MTVGITDLAHSLRKNTAGVLKSVPLGRWQQLACAALGHKSLASFQSAQDAEQEPHDFTYVPYVVPDLDLLAERAAELDISLPPDQLWTLVKSAFKDRLPATKVNRTYDDLAGDFHDIVQQEVLSDDTVSSAMANANYDGVEEVYLQTDLEPRLATIDEPHTQTVSVQVTLGLDLERPYSGHQVICNVAVTSERSGRCCFERPEVEILSAGLDQDWGDDDDRDGPPARSLAEALAEELGIKVEEAEELVDAEPMELTGSSGDMVYGYEFDFTDHASPALAAKLQQIHGSLQLEVGPDFFDGVRNADFPN